MKGEACGWLSMGEVEEKHVCIEVVESEVYIRRRKRVKELVLTWPSAVNTLV